MKEVANNINGTCITFLLLLLFRLQNSSNLLTITELHFLHFPSNLFHFSLQYIAYIITATGYDVSFILMHFQ